MSIYDEVQKRRILLPVLAGGLGGGLNALLFYVTSSSAFYLDWHIVLAGLAQGFLCVGLPLVLLEMLRARRRTFVWLGAAIAGYVSGWLSFSAVCLSLGELDGIELWTWPFQDASSAVDILTSPFTLFGSIGSILYVGVALLRHFRLRQPGFHVGVGLVSGFVGYGLFWFSLEWPFEEAWQWLGLIHGGVWGAVVGPGLWLGENSRGENR